MEHLTESIKGVVDTLSIGTVVATLIGWLPSIAAALSIIWTLIRIYEWAKTHDRVFKDKE